ncbi:MAG TPA: EAL domain-containing protein, partial [Solirubrobacteraceae bacterium]
MHDVAASAAVPADNWPSALQGVLGQPQRIGVEYQPIVDLRHATICGYEALARFRDAPDVSPREWFVAAARLGCAGALEAQVVQAALVAHPLLVRDRFIAVNVSPAALVAGEVQQVLEAEGRLLRHLVVEIADGEDGTPLAALRAAAKSLRARGAAVAVHGLGYHVALNARYVKLPAAALAGGALDVQLEAAVVAEQIETPAQLDALVDLGVAYGQGYALGCPTPALTELRGDVRAQIERRSRADDGTTLATLLDEPPVPAPADERPLCSLGAASILERLLDAGPSLLLA